MSLPAGKRAKLCASQEALRHTEGVFTEAVQPQPETSPVMVFAPIPINAFASSETSSDSRDRLGETVNVEFICRNCVEGKPDDLQE